MKKFLAFMLLFCVSLSCILVSCDETENDGLGDNTSENTTTVTESSTTLTTTAATTEATTVIATGSSTPAYSIPYEIQGDFELLSESVLEINMYDGGIAYPVISRIAVVDHINFGIMTYMDALDEHENIISSRYVRGYQRVYMDTETHSFITVGIAFHGKAESEGAFDLFVELSQLTDADMMSGDCQGNPEYKSANIQLFGMRLDKMFPDAIPNVKEALDFYVTDKFILILDSYTQTSFTSPEGVSGKEVYTDFSFVTEDYFSSLFQDYLARFS